MFHETSDLNSVYMACMELKLNIYFKNMFNLYEMLAVGILAIAFRSDTG